MSPLTYCASEEELHVRQALAVAKLDGRDVMGEQGIDGQGTPNITTVEAAHDLGQHSEGLEEPSPSTDQLVDQGFHTLQLPEVGAAPYKWPGYCTFHIQNVPV